MRKFMLFLLLFSLLYSCSSDTNLLEEDVSTNLNAGYKEKETKTNCSLNDLVLMYAPEYRFHPNETWWPSDPEWFMGRTQMRFNRGGGSSDLQILNKFAVTNNVIHNRHLLDGSSTCRNYDERSGSGYQSDYFLQIPNDSQENTTRQGVSNSSLWRLLVHIRDVPFGEQGWKDIQYWMFFPYNDIPNVGAPFDAEHEGDWEHVTVRIKSDCTILKIYTSAHNSEGRWFDPIAECNNVAVDLCLVNGTHPIIYVAQGSHASYDGGRSYAQYDFSTSTYLVHTPDIQRSWPKYRDRINAYGSHWQSWTQANHYVVEGCSDYGCLNLSSIPNWVKYSGRWGEIGGGGIDELDGHGPYGPTYKRQFFNDDNDGYISGGVQSTEGQGIIFAGGGKQWTTTDATQMINCTKEWFWVNDEIEFLRVNNVDSGTKIRLYDDSCGRTNRDWTEVEIMQDIRNRTVYISDLEGNGTQCNSDYCVTYYDHDGSGSNDHVKGKISLIEIENN